jgi:ATP-dependent DNA helicase RecG
MIKELLTKDEGKTLEFKENSRSKGNIIRTIVAFANTAGGALVIGVRDKTREVIGVPGPLMEEEKISNMIADGIRPALIPDIQIISWRDRELVVLSIPHTVGPFYIETEGPEKGVYIRLGSTNRRAGPEMIEQIRRLARNTCFDELPCTEINSEAIDFRAASEFFSKMSRQLTSPRMKTLGLLKDFRGREVPTQGAVLLFGKTRLNLFPDAVIRCARFRGRDTARFIDQTEIDEYLPGAIDRAISFIERHTIHSIEIGRVQRRDIPQYPTEAIREAVINAIVHCDYSISGMEIKIGIFDDRIEITNPGILPFGLTIDAAMAGVSRLRNRVIGRVFRELKLIEQWGSGINRILTACREAGLNPPRFEELGTSFRVTLFSEATRPKTIPEWQKRLMEFLDKNHEISTKEAAGLWKTSDRTARTRLRKLVNEGLLSEIGTGPKDPKRTYAQRRRIQ